MSLLSPFQNQRRDAYSSPPENRWRVQVDTMRAIRAAAGEGCPILYRVSAADFVPGGVDLSLTVPFARPLEGAGADCMDVSAGTTDSPPESILPTEDQPLGCFTDLAAAVRTAVNVPVIAVGKIGTVKGPCPELTKTRAGRADTGATAQALRQDQPLLQHRLGDHQRE